MVRYGKVWQGMVWYDMVWYDMVWYGMVWYGMVKYGRLRDDTKWINLLMYFYYFRFFTIPTLINLMYFFKK